MIREASRKLVKGENLKYDEVREVMSEIMSGETSPTLISAYLVALRMKGETVEEISGSAQGMRDAAQTLNYDGDLLEIVGTGGDEAYTFNISTTSAFVIAATGVKVAKHGNRSVSSKSGAADVLESLGAKIDITPQQSVEVLDKCNFAFLFAQKYHTSMKYVGPVRSELGLRTVFNILGPLTNPAGASHNVIGVYSEELVRPIADVLVNLGVKRALVVYGMDRMDEISLSAKTKVAEIKDNKVIAEYEIDPRDYGFELCDKEDIVGGDSTVNAEITKDILTGKLHGPKRDIVILNAAAGIFVAKNDITIKEAVEMAKDAIDSGKAYEVLQKYVEVSNSFDA